MGKNSPQPTVATERKIVMRHQLNWSYETDRHPEYHDPSVPSETIPGQAMSVPEIIRRQQAGLPTQGVRVPFYSGEEEMPDFDRMDLSELQAFREHADELLGRYRKALKERDDQLHQEKIEKAIEEKLKREQKVLEKVPPKDDQGTTP